MAGSTYIQVLKLTVITEILLLCVAQNTHRQNVAIGKTCGISSKYVSWDTCSAAINGDNKYLNYPGNCIHTADSDNSPFWWVDLGDEFTISTMTIYGRTSHTGRMAQVNIFLDKSFIKRFTSQDTWTDDKHVITVGRAGRIVNITKDSNTGSTMNICEVEVWVCDDGWYGDCTQACTYCPRGSVCDKVDGNCTTCDSGFQLPHCEACDNGWYGDNCTQACGHCAGGAVCDKVTGSCTSCQTGFQSPLCKVCRDGWYGNDCRQTCGHCAGGAVCDKVTGSCTSCQTGFQSPFCKVCSDGLYGNDCQQTCGQCAGGAVCDKVTGSCTSCQTGFQPPLCKNCENGWYGNSCVETCGHCVGGNSTCDKTNGSCPFCDGAFQPPLCKDNLSSKPLITTLNPSSSVQATGTDYSSFVSTAGMSCVNDKETISVAGPVAGAAVGSGVVFLVIGIILGWWLRKSRSQQPSARGHSPYEIPMTSDAGTSRSTSRPDDKVDSTSDYTNIGYSTNVYDALKAPDDNNTAAYTSLDFHTDDHR